MRCYCYSSAGIGSPSLRPNMAHQEKDSFTRSNAWCCRFLTLIQCFDPAALIGPVAMLRHQPLQPKLAGLAKQVRSDLALRKVAEKAAIRRQQFASLVECQHRALYGIVARHRSPICRLDRST